MNRVKNWGTIYESGQEVRIGQIIKSLYNIKNWHELHIALWTWLSIDGEREKAEWFDKFNVPEVKHYCFACEEAEMSFYYPLTDSSAGEEDCIKPSFCHYCPLTNSTSDLCGTGFYDQWCHANLEQREELAREIANLEWNIK